MSTQLTITLDEDIKMLMARRIVEECSGGSVYGNYETDGHDVLFQQKPDHFSVWPDGVYAVSVLEFVNTEDNDFSDAPAWEYADDYDEWCDAYLAAHPDVDTDSDEFTASNVAAWAENADPSEAFVAAIEDYRRETHEAAISLALNSLADAVIIEIDDNGYREYRRVYAPAPA